MKVNKDELVNVFNALTELIYQWNEPEDNDRGRSNDPLCLMLWDDGGGKLGVQFADAFNEQISFDDIEQLVDYLMEWFE